MKSLLFTVALSLAVTTFAQTPATDRPVPPAPPRTDAPGAPINPRQNTTAAPDQTAAPATATPAAPAETAPAPAAIRELKFAEADSDGDKRLSLNEYVTYVEARMATRSTLPLNPETIDRFRQLDQDNDGMVSEAEATVQQQPPAQVAPGAQPPPPPRR